MVKVETEAANKKDQKRKSVITVPESVITVPEPVITERLIVIEKKSTDYGDKVMRSMKQGLQQELANLEKGNGNSDRVIGRIKDKKNEFDEVVRTQKVDIKLAKEISSWIDNELDPVVNQFRKRPAADLSIETDAEGFTNVTYQQAA